MTSSKMVEMKKQIEAEKPLIVAVSKVKQKNHAEISEMDYDIPGYSIHPINLDNDTGRYSNLLPGCSGQISDTNK